MFPVKQGHAEDAFQVADTVAECGLRHAGDFGRAREILRAPCHFEQFQGGERKIRFDIRFSNGIHCKSPSSQRFLYGSHSENG